jgi:uncharacterized LabA/DUF88 family protein
VPDDRTATNDEGPLEATLVFREQSDGRKVARLPGGKVVLVDWDYIERVRDGECWHVKLVHRDTYTVATPVEKARAELATSLSSPFGAALAKAMQTPTPSVAVPSPPRVPSPSPPEPIVNPLPSRSEPRAPAIQPSRVVGMNDRVAMFVDGANMDQACRSAGYFIDYRRARNFFLAHGLFYAAYYYIADYTASDPQQMRYLDFLAHADFIVRRKAVKAIRDSETGERVLKANVDTELILDLVNTADNYDLAFLFSGDSDFERAVDLLRSRGKRVYVVTARAVLSRELAYVADKPVFFIEEFRAPLERDPKPDAKREM